MAILVVYLPLLRIAQDLVSLGGFLESFLRIPVAWIPVRVVLHGQPAVTLLNFLFRGVAAYAKDLVIASLGHGLVEFLYCSLIATHSEGACPRQTALI